LQPTSASSFASVAAFVAVHVDGQRMIFVGFAGSS
jgi:hypothetical protein